jgi:pantoate kinase
MARSSVSAGSLAQSRRQGLAGAGDAEGARSNADAGGRASASVLAASDAIDSGEPAEAEAEDALRELQDPAVQQQVKAMMEDPAFQESMKSYMEQIIKDPMFESLKKQTEDMLQQEGFMEQIQKAFAEVGGPGGLAAALGALGGPAAAESTVEEPESEK